MISTRLRKLREFSQQRDFKVFRKTNSIYPLQDFKEKQIPLVMRSALLLKLMCEQETPIILPGEKIAFMRTIKDVPTFYDQEDVEREYVIRPGEYYNVINNICVNWNLLLCDGLQKKYDYAKQNMEGASREEKDFLEGIIICVDAVLELTSRYEKEARRMGNETLADVLHNVPCNPAKSFHEALQSLRLMSSMFYLAGNYQLGFGRMDQYLYPFYQRDIENGKISRDEAKELIAEFFISLNRDTDLYPGIQQGDNGQSLVLGGVKPDGTSGINDLTYLILEVSCELKLIDPKINLRVDRNTPQDLLELGSRLTREGLGFPQYENDEVVIPALVKHGYDLEDARDYTVAACWEFIIPGKGMDIVNQGAVSFPAAVHEAFLSLKEEDWTEELLDESVRENIRLQVLHVIDRRMLGYLPSPIISMFMDGALEAKTDASISAKYHNTGIHGAGISNGADALVILRNFMRANSKEKLIALKAAVASNFSNNPSLYEELRTSYPKIGNDTKDGNEAVRFLFDSFAEACERFSSFKRTIRPGSGAAQWYIWLIKQLPWGVESVMQGAGEDGRLAGEPFASSLAPSQGVKVDGILSVLKSFSHVDYQRIMNGGPITVEFDPVSLKDDSDLKKLASLVRYFIELGNQQLQLNVLNTKTLEDAVRHPERHRNLIVRVWGWSGYFCELAPEFQQQIIHRHKYAI